MPKLEDASVAELFGEIRERLKNEITNEELTNEFWEFMKPSEREFRDLGEDLELHVMDEADIEEEVQRAMTDSQVFKILVRLAYLDNVTTLTELKALETEARHILRSEYNQHHGMGL